MTREDTQDLKLENRILREQIKQVQQRFEEKIAELSLIRELGTTLFHIGSFELTCRSILHVIIKNSIAQNCSIMLLDQEREQLFLICASDLEKISFVLEPNKVFSKEGITYKFRLGEGAAGLALGKRHSILIQDTKEDDNFISGGKDPVKIGSLLSIPLLVANEPFGVLNLSHTDTNIFEQSDVHLFNIIANFIALAIKSSINHEKLKNSEEKYRVLSENSKDGIAIIQDDLHIYTNPKYLEMIGYGVGELKKISFRSLIILPDPKPYHFPIDSFLKHGTDCNQIEAQLSCKNGKQIDVEINSSSILHKGKKAIILSIRDITDRKILERQLVHAQKMEAIGTLAGGIAHNFNNLLMSIQGYASLMLIETDTGHSHYEMLKKIEKQVTSGSKMAGQLLGYAREGKYEIKPIDLNLLIQDNSFTFGTARKEIKVNLELEKNLFPIEADYGQIEQVLMNIFVNAADAMPIGGDLFIKTANTTHKNMLGKSYKAKPGNYVVLEIRDTGMGMDQETIDRIFEPFFTTKDVGRGTGLGLASVYGTVKGHGGYIDVHSEYGQGTTFKIYLPASLYGLHGEKEMSEDIEEGEETILFIDDEDTVLEVGELMLQRLGYKVIPAANGADALEAYEQNRSDIDMVILDMIMPDIGGGETYDQLRKLNPDVKVLLSSGYSIDGQAIEIMNRGCDGFIQKPFTLNKLAEKTREVLDRP